MTTFLTILSIIFVFFSVMIISQWAANKADSMLLSSDEKLKQKENDVNQN